MEQDEDEQHVEGEGLFLSLVHTEASELRRRLGSEIGIVNLFFSFDEFSPLGGFWGSFMQILHGDSPKKRLFFPTF